MKRLVILAGVLALPATAITVAACAYDGGVDEQVIAVAGIGAPYAVDVTQPADVVIARAIVPPGASFGWHSHRSAAVVVVRSGTLTLYDSADATCTPRRVGAGRGFVEQPGHVHLARNETRTAVDAIVTRLGLQHGVNPDVPGPRPGSSAF